MARTEAEIEAEITQASSAISAILTAMASAGGAVQAYTINGRQVSREQLAAQLAELRAHRKDLQRELSEVTSGGYADVGSF